jgi:hypothetical protein
MQTVVQKHVLNVSVSSILMVLAVVCIAALLPCLTIWVLGVVCAQTSSQLNALHAVATAACCRVLPALVECCLTAVLLLCMTIWLHGAVCVQRSSQLTTTHAAAAACCRLLPMHPQCV